MINLSQYNHAMAFKEEMAKGPQYVEIIKGERKGTIGWVTDIKCRFHSSHLYQISAGGKRLFWIDGEYLKHLKGQTTYVKVDLGIEVFDLLQRKISVGDVIMFPRSMGNKVEMVIGTVKAISKKGAVYTRPFTSSSVDMPSTVRVGKPSVAMIMDRTTIDRVVMAKLSAS